MMRKIFIFCLFLIVFYLICPSAVWAQGTCTAKKNVVAQTCELDSNNCQAHYIPQVIEKEGAVGTVACSCQCIPDPNNPPPAPPPGAACDYVRDGNNICLNHFIDCLFVTGSGACCDTPDECPSPPTPTPSPPPVPPPQPSDACIETAIGSVCGLDNPANFVSWFLKFALGFAGGIAFLLIIIGGFQILTSSGEPEKIKAGKELITSAITGLLLIVFSVFILRIIGVEVLKIFPK